MRLEVSRLACELYHLAYLPVEVYPPAAGTLEGLDPDYLRQYGLVPLDRFGTLLTVAMPALVSSSVLDGLHAGEATAVAPFDYSRLLWAAIFGYVLFAEIPSTRTWLGGAVIIR